MKWTAPTVEPIQSGTPFREVVLESVKPHEKCDFNCPAYAVVSVLTADGGRITTCGHHYDTSPKLQSYPIARDSRRMVSS